MNRPITDGNFDPLRAPGTNAAPAVATGPSFSAGQFVRASLDNTAFFKTRPKGDADADKLLKRGTSMKVISTASNYVKVELDSGDVGFVPAIMLEDPNAATSSSTTRPGEYQVYPPLPTSGPVEPLPGIDPAGLPPEGAIPTVIDPEAAPTQAPPPVINPPTGDFAAPAPTVAPAPPVEPKVEDSIPLPPNGEEGKEP
jgi:hypothetical protein